MKNLCPAQEPSLLTGTWSAEEYAAMWGCDPCYDTPPRQANDGYMFYNFAVEGHNYDFLTAFLGAIDRTIQGVIDPKDIPELEELKHIVEDRIKSIDNAKCPQKCLTSMKQTDTLRA